MVCGAQYELGLRQPRVIAPLELARQGAERLAHTEHEADAVHALTAPPLV